MISCRQFIVFICFEIVWTSERRKKQPAVDSLEFNVIGFGIGALGSGKRMNRFNDSLPVICFCYGLAKNMITPLSHDGTNLMGSRVGC